MDQESKMTTETECHITAGGFHLYTLIEHDFIIGLQAGAIEDVSDSYIGFTKTVVSLYHRHHCKEEIRSALHLVEDLLVILMEDVEELCEILRKFLNRAINFIKKFAVRISEWFNTNIVKSDASHREEYTEEKADVFTWDAPFTELVELTDALLSEKKFGDIVNAR